MQKQAEIKRECRSPVSGLRQGVTTSYLEIELGVPEDAGDVIFLFPAARVLVEESDPA